MDSSTLATLLSDIFIIESEIDRLFDAFKFYGTCHKHELLDSDIIIETIKYFFGNYLTNDNKVDLIRDLMKWFKE